MSKVLSIIIPTYNMEKYLRHCLQSLVTTPELMTSLEVLVINDGSKDSSSAIGHEFMDKYPETFRVIDKPNGNYGSCVNRGIQEATGKYVKVLDADDSFNNNSFEEFLSKLKDCNEDLIITDYDFVDVNGTIFKRESYPFHKEQAMDIDSICATTSFKSIQMHALTYRLQLIKDMKYHQTEGISYTDQEWIFLPMTGVKTVAYLPIELYLYLRGREGQTMDLKVINKSLSHYFKIINNRLDELKRRKIKVSDNMEKYMYHKTMLLATFIYRAVLIRRAYPLAELVKLDDKIHSLDPKLFDMLSNERMKGLGLKYICYFRKHHNYVPPIITKIYNILWRISKK